MKLDYILSVKIRPAIITLLIFFVSLAIFAFNFRDEPTGFQTRFALFARYMLQDGPSFFPHTYMGPYPDYPATAIYLIYLSSLALGKIMPFSALLPTAIVSALIVAITFRIGALHSTLWGLFGAMFSLLTHSVLEEGRSISLDQYTSLATVLCFYLAYSETNFNRWRRRAVIPLILAAGFAFRGPLGLVVPTGVLSGHYLLRKDYRGLLFILSSGVILLVICSALLLYCAYLEGGIPFVDRVLHFQVLGRLSGQPERGYLYYFLDCLGPYALSYPLAVFVISLHLRPMLRGCDSGISLLRHLAIWIMIVLVGMTLPGTKHLRYILPVVPALSLAAAFVFVSPLEKTILSLTKRFLLGFFSLLPIGLFVASLFGLSLGRRFFPGLEVPWTGVAISMGLLSIIVRTINARVENPVNLSVVLTAVAVLAFFVAHIFVMEAISYGHERTRPFAEKLEALKKQRPGNVVFYKIGPDGEDIRLIANMDKLICPDFIKSPSDILAYQPFAYFIAEQKQFNLLPTDISQRTALRFNGKIGHRDSVIFTLKDFQRNDRSSEGISPEPIRSE